MIERLGVTKLKKYKFDQDSIDRLTNWEKYEMFLLTDEGIFWASNIEKQIYSGLDGEKKYYFRRGHTYFPQRNLNLVPEYYSLKEEVYLEQQKKIAGILFNKLSAREDFRNIEITETKELINGLKSHKMYDRLSSKKEYVEKLNWYIKWLNAQQIKNKDEQLNWQEIFDSIDIDQKITPKTYKTNNLQEQQYYISNASFTTTLQLLREFKKNTYLLSDRGKLAYVNSLNIQPPIMGKTDSTLFNQTVFEGRHNFYDFILAYKQQLDEIKKPLSFQAQNQANKIDLLHTRLGAVSYFAPMEGNCTKIPMFTLTSNEEFRTIVKQELEEIKMAEADGNKKAPIPYQSRDIIRQERIFETSLENMISLFNYKFNDAKQSGFKTTTRYAKHELQNLEHHYQDAMKWFPLFDQWKDFLIEISKAGVVPKGETSAIKTNPKSSPIPKNKFSLPQIAIAYYVMGIIINKNNARDILKKYSEHISEAKLIQKRISRLKDITTLSDNKRSNTTLLNNLKAAKQLINSTKNSDAKAEIIRIIRDFEAKYRSKM